MPLQKRRTNMSDFRTACPCPICGVGFFLPSGKCDHCGTYHKDIRPTATLKVTDIVSFRDPPKIPHPSKPMKVNIMCLEFNTVNEFHETWDSYIQAGWNLWMMGSPVNRNAIGAVFMREIKDEG
jgi:hypothetical protein